MDGGNRQEKVQTGRTDMPVPLVRHLSTRLTPALAKLPITPNQITTVSLLCGLGSAWCMLIGGRGWMIGGGAMLVVCYVLDNCDGEIATLKNQATRFGGHYDTFVDWVVHAAFFAALGIGVGRATENELWLWMGWIAAAGGTVNYLLGLYLDAREASAGAGPVAVQHRPEGVKDWLVLIFRELFRADFCFIVLVLAVFDLTWLLLPAGAIGAQIYWLTRFVAGAGDYHV